MDATTALLFTIAAAMVGLVSAIDLSMRITRMSAGTEKMRSIAQLIRQGALAFLQTEWSVMGLCIAVVAMLLGLFLEHGLLTAGSFITGALFSLLAGSLGMHTAMFANVRTTEAARTAFDRALRTAFLSGAVLGLSIVSLGLLGIAGGTLLLGTLTRLDSDSMLHILVGFGFGASSIALFARVGGGIFAQAANIGADFNRDDPQHHPVIASHTGGIVGETFGTGADLFESFVGSLLAAMLIGSSTLGTESAVFFPLGIASIAVLASIASLFLIRTSARRSMGTALHMELLGSSLIVAIIAWFLSRMLFPTLSLGIYVALLMGLLAGIVIRWLTEYSTSADYAPVRHLAEALETGGATNLLSGIAIGTLSTAFPILCLVLAIGIASIAAGLYGIAIAAVGMLSTLGLSLAFDACGPVLQCAGGIAAMSGLPAAEQSNTERLHAAGKRTSAIGKGFTVGAAALTALALFFAYTSTAYPIAIDLMQPMVMIGLLIGAMLPFLFSALIMHAIARASHEMITLVRHTPRHHQGNASGEPRTCVSISTEAAIREMLPLGLLAILAPIITGLTLGTTALGGLLAGVLVTGMPLAISMTTSSSAWDSAKNTIEAGDLRSKGSDPHPAAIVGDVVGNPFTDVSGLSISVLIKLMTIVSLLTVELYSSSGIIG